MHQSVPYRDQFTPCQPHHHVDSTGFTTPKEFADTELRDAITYVAGILTTLSEGKDL